MWADLLTDTEDILDSTAEDGHLRLALGDVRDKLGIAADIPVQIMDGFFSRPNLPDSDGAARARYLYDGYDKTVISTWDSRYNDKLGDAGYGDRGIYGKGPQRVLVKEDSNSVTLYTEDENGLPVMISLTGDDGMIRARNGDTTFEIANDSITLIAGGSSLSVDAKGVTINGMSFVANTLSGQLGMNKANPMQPNPQILQSILAGPAGPIGAPAPTWTVAIP